jgi:hypothetical protein
MSSLPFAQRQHVKLIIDFEATSSSGISLLLYLLSLREATISQTSKLSVTFLVPHIVLSLKNPCQPPRQSPSTHPYSLPPMRILSIHPYPLDQDENTWDFLNGLSPICQISGSKQPSNHHDLYQGPRYLGCRWKGWRARRGDDLERCESGERCG